MSIEFDRVYFDIETYSPGERPQFTNTIIAVGLTELDGRLTLLRSWQKTEKEVLDEFYGRLKNLVEMRPRRRLVGHNVLGFDLPLFIARAQAYELDKTEDIIEVVYRQEVIDLLQCLLPYNGFRYKGLNAERLSRIFDLTPIEYTGKDISKLYENKDYEAIEKHLTSDLKFIIDLHEKLAKISANELRAKLSGPL